MKKLGLLLMVTILAITVSAAQNKGNQRNFDPQEKAKEQTKILKEKLQLTDEQEPKVYEIVLDGLNKMADVRNEMRNGGDRDNARAKLTNIRKEQNKKMEKVLTEDQFKKYQKFLEERRSQYGRGRGNGPR